MVSLKSAGVELKKVQGTIVVPAEHGEDEGDEEQQAADVGDAARRREQRHEPRSQPRAVLQHPEHAPQPERAEHRRAWFDDEPEHSWEGAQDDQKVEPVPRVLPVLLGRQCHDLQQNLHEVDEREEVVEERRAGRERGGLAVVLQHRDSGSLRSSTRTEIGA